MSFVDPTSAGTPPPEVSLPPEPPPPARSFRRKVLPVLLAWVVIIGAVVFILLTPGRAAQDGGSGRELWLLNAQARFFVGLHEWFGTMGGDLYAQAESLDRGSPLQRLGFVALAGELAGPKEALRLLGRLRKEWDAHDGASGREWRLAGLLQDLYESELTNGGPPALGEPERRELRRELGWLGELALTPPGSAPQAREAVFAPARRAVIALGVAAAGVVGALLVGFVLAVLLVILVLSRRLRAHGEPTGSGTGGIYAETFAVWIVLFLVLSFGGSLLAHALPQLHRYRLLLSGGLMLCSLAALAWPVLRGVRWNQLRREIGLIAGPRPLLEPLLGVGCYLAALPLTVAAFVAVLVLVRLFGGSMGMPVGANDGPSHPLVGYITGGDWVVWLQAIFLAAVVAPVVEETMFRGVLYRHLREASARAGTWVNVVFSALVAAFVFAVIHPQGWLLVPVLMALALGFTAAREWRGTLLGSMTAHGLHNGLVTLLAISLLG